MTTLINTSLVKKIAKDGGRRVSKEFIRLFNDYAHRKLATAIACHNGSKKTLDCDVAITIGLMDNR